MRRGRVKRAALAAGQARPDHRLTKGPGAAWQPPQRASSCWTSGVAGAGSPGLDNQATAEQPDDNLLEQAEPEDAESVNNTKTIQPAAARAAEADSLDDQRGIHNQSSTGSQNGWLGIPSSIIAASMDGINDTAGNRTPSSGTAQNRSSQTRTHNNGTKQSEANPNSNRNPNTNTSEAEGSPPVAEGSAGTDGGSAVPGNDTINANETNVTRTDLQHDLRQWWERVRELLRSATVRRNARRRTNASEPSSDSSGITDSTPHGDHEPGTRPVWHVWVVFLAMVVMLMCLFLELFPAWITLLTTLVVIWNLRIVSSADAIQGFSNEALVTVAALFVVVKGADKPGLIARAANRCLGSSSSERVALLRFCSLVFVGGMFINNTPLIALLMPIIRDWARTRDFAPSKFLMPMAYSSICGGYMCMLGASTHLVVNGMLMEATGESFGFFAPLPLGVCGGAVAMWYLFQVGVRLLPAHKGGLFRTLKERTSDMVCEVQFMNECPLIGFNIWEALDHLGIPRGALLKVVRQPVRLEATPMARNRFMRQTSTLTTPTSPTQVIMPRALSATGFEDLARVSSFVTDPEASTTSYGDRTRAAWGTFPRNKRRPRSLTEPAEPTQPGVVRKRAGLEIFPVPEHEVLEGEDTLLLSLPQQDLIALAHSDHLATLMRNVQRQRQLQVEPLAGSEEATTSLQLPGRQVSEPSEAAPSSEEAEEPDLSKSIRITDVDLLEVPGVKSEFLELVVSRSNPFIGKALEGKVRTDFETHYSVAILAIRNNWEETSRDQMTSSVLSSKGDFNKIILPGDSEQDSEERARRDLRQPPLGPGDAVLVLTRIEDFKRVARGRDFLATTAVAQGVEEDTDPWDYVPTALFVIVLFVVAVGGMSMVQGMVLLMIVYVLGGWVDRRQVTDCINWEMLILIGSALGMARAVQVSGLSSLVASGLAHMEVGRHGMVFILFLFVMVVSELVTNSAAAALGFPLALDIANTMGLKSVKPLAMTVMLASATCFASPISSPATLMVMGPGNYTFLDFLKVGLIMDVIYWIVCSSMLPVFYPLE